MAAVRFQIDERELQLAQWIHVLELESAAEQFIKLWEELFDEEYSLPRWAWIRRRRSRYMQEQVMRLFEIFRATAREQDQY